jgi:hypothetical protein
MAWDIITGGGPPPIFVDDSGVVYNGGSGTSLDADFLFGAESLGESNIAQIFFDKSKGAFRAGTATGSSWSDANVASGSVALGPSTRASGVNSVAVGPHARAHVHGERCLNASGESAVTIREVRLAWAEDLTESNGIYDMKLPDNTDWTLPANTAGIADVYQVAWISSSRWTLFRYQYTFTSATGALVLSTITTTNLATVGTSISSAPPIASGLAMVMRARGLTGETLRTRNIGTFILFDIP